VSAGCGGDKGKGGATNLKVGGQCIGKWEGQYIKNPEIRKRRGYMTPP